MASKLDTSYEPFSREPEYLALNREFVETLDLDGHASGVDIACGTGSVTEFLWRALAAHAGRPALVGVDISRESLQLAVEHFASDPELAGGLERGEIRFVEGSGYDLPLAANAADVATIGNAVHLFDLERLLPEVARVLRPDGTVAFNTSFYAGTFAPGTERFYTEWLKHALLYVKAEHGVTRKKGLAAPAFSHPWLSPAQYAQALESCGFSVLGVHQRTVMMGRQAFEAVGAYAGLASVLMSGYPVAAACDALGHAVAPALAAVGRTEVPRRWLEITARKRRAPW